MGPRFECFPASFNSRPPPSTPFHSPPVHRTHPPTPATPPPPSRPPPPNHTASHQHYRWGGHVSNLAEQPAPQLTARSAVPKQGEQAEMWAFVRLTCAFFFLPNKPAPRLMSKGSEKYCRRLAVRFAPPRRRSRPQRGACFVGHCGILASRIAWGCCWGAPCVQCDAPVVADLPVSHRICCVASGVRFIRMLVIALDWRADVD